jgi:cytochrome c-type biogenesis protein CcsB
MSNGYESMIFISWVTILAGFIFNRLSEFALPATAVLAAMTLLVSNLSFMDPEITNLVPVLQSYWLTLHVSVIISSYAFLGLGFVLAIVNLILFVFINPRNKQQIKETANLLTFLNQKTLIVGVHLLTIGTFLGAIWANESWGRYWGWDAKETWSLITIIVYTFVTHSRLIKGLNGIFMFNVMSLYAFASVLMTYFGVNYYLTGLHSYASGDPIPVPNFVYIAVVAFIALTVMAGMSYRHNKLAVKEAE